MGAWRTLHLFSDQIFQELTIPQLQERKYDISSIYIKFLKYCKLGGIAHLSPTQLEEICRGGIEDLRFRANQFEDQFLKHIEYDRLPDDKARHEYLKANDWYEFSKFFEYFVFLTCADFYPHLPLGKGGLGSKLKATQGSVAANGLEKLCYESYHPCLCSDSMGIEGWISHEDVALLFYGQDQIQADYEEFLAAFLSLLKVAYEHKLGLLVGIDMREDFLEKTHTFKLVEENYWEDVSTQGLLFTR